MVTIRLARTGAKKRPFYHLNVAESSARRDGRFIERIGYFNPIAKGKEQRLSINLERVDYWLSVGAQPSERVVALVRQMRRSNISSQAAQVVDAEQGVAGPEPTTAAEAVVNDGNAGETS